MAKSQLLSGRAGKYNDLSNGWENYQPRAIYFYYWDAGEVRVYMWVDPDNDPITNLETRVAPLIKNARVKGQSPGPIGFAFGEVPWWRRSFLVVAAEGANGFDGIPVDIERDDHSPNHCFFDGGYKKRIVVDGQDASYIWTVNYMKTKSGKDIPADTIHRFNFNFDPMKRFPLDDGGSDHGTNMGPPIGPP